MEPELFKALLSEFESVIDHARKTRDLDEKHALLKEAVAIAAHADVLVQQAIRDADSRLVELGARLQSL